MVLFGFLTKTLYVCVHKLNCVQNMNKPCVQFLFSFNINYNARL